VLTNDLVEVKKTIDAGFNADSVGVHPKHGYQTNALIIACQNQNPIMLEVLLKAGADPDAIEIMKNSEITLLYYVANSEEMTRLLLAYGADPNGRKGTGSRLILSALAKSPLEVINLYLKHGIAFSVIKESEEQAIIAAASNKDSRVLVFLINRGLNPKINEKTQGYALKLASEKGIIENVKTLLEHKVNPDIAVSYEKQPPIYFAVKNGHAEIVDLLLAHKAKDLNVVDYRYQKTDGPTFAVAYKKLDVLKVYHKYNYNLHNALIKAIRSDLPEFTEYILSTGVDLTPASHTYGYAIHIAAMNRNQEHMRLLLKAGADVNQKSPQGDTPLFLAIREGILENVIFLHQHGADLHFVTPQGENALKVADYRGHYDVVEYLIEHGVKGSTPAYVNYLETVLVGSARQGDYRQVKNLLDKGITVNSGSIEYIRKKYIDNKWTTFNEKDYTGVTALMEASEYGYIEIVKLLLTANADLNAKDTYGFTALHKAIGGQQNTIVKLLIEAGADINATDNENWTPLTWCAVVKNHEAAKLLIKQGADPAIASIKEETPYTIAVKQNDQVMILILGRKKWIRQ